MPQRHLLRSPSSTPPIGRSVPSVGKAMEKSRLSPPAGETRAPLHMIKQDYHVTAILRVPAHTPREKGTTWIHSNLHTHMFTAALVTKAQSGRQAKFLNGWGPDRRWCLYITGKTKVFRQKTRWQEEGWPAPKPRVQPESQHLHANSAWLSTPARHLAVKPFPFHLFLNIYLKGRFAEGKTKRNNFHPWFAPHMAATARAELTQS